VRDSMRPASPPATCTLLDDVAHLPFTAKSDLRDHYPFGLFARPVSQLARLHASSGTTGRPPSSATRAATSTAGPT
jgi:Coenzyme F390 synthetase